MSRIIYVTAPANLTEEDRYLFESENSYTIQTLKTELVKDVFVTYAGLCLKNLFLIKESVHGYQDKLSAFQEEAISAYKAAHSKGSERIIYLNNPNTYLLIHHPWFNYYHWITESLQRLWLVRGELHKLILVLPGFYKNFSGIRESLEPFTFKDIFYIPDGCQIQIRNALIPQLKPICSAYYPEIVNEIRSFYSNWVCKKNLTLDLGNRIYISRANSYRRRVANEGELLDLLEGYKFKVIEADKFSFFEQVAVFFRTKYLTSIHGAGLTNMNFMKPETFVLELHKRKTNCNDHHSFVYWNLASVLQIHYYHQLCDPVSIEADFYTADLIVNSDVLKYNIDKMLTDSGAS